MTKSPPINKDGPKNKYKSVRLRKMPNKKTC